MIYPRIIEFLATEPDGPAVAQHLALEGSRAPRPMSVAILGLSTDAKTTLLGAFGLDSEETRELVSVPLWQSTPWTDAMRDGEAVTCSSEPCQAWPLTHGLQKLGAVYFRFPTPVSADDLEGMAHVMSICALYFQFREPDVTSEADPEDLTDRQRDVLRLMSNGMTNAQIGKQLGFSESTIKQETMRVFRILGVNDRNSAGELASQMLAPNGHPETARGKRPA